MAVLTQKDLGVVNTPGRKHMVSPNRLVQKDVAMVGI